MAYKRYFYRNGKKFGPYYYESYRDKTGKVKKKYVGTVDPKEKEKELEKKNQKIVTPTKVFKKLNRKSVLKKVSENFKSFGLAKPVVDLKVGKIGVDRVKDGIGVGVSGIGKGIGVGVSGMKKSVGKVRKGVGVGIERVRKGIGAGVGSVRRGVGVGVGGIGKGVGVGVSKLNMPKLGMPDVHFSVPKLNHKKLFLVVGLVLLLGLFLIVFANPRLVGFAVSEESSVEEFGTSEVGLDIIEPAKLLGDVVSENKNKRMEFDVNGNKLRLYFDVLNYSEYVSKVALVNVTKVVNVSLVNVTEIEDVNVSLVNVSDVVMNVSDVVMNESLVNVTDVEVNDSVDVNVSDVVMNESLEDVNVSVELNETNVEVNDTEVVDEVEVNDSVDVNERVDDSQEDDVVDEVETDVETVVVDDSQEVVEDVVDEVVETDVETVVVDEVETVDSQESVDSDSESSSDSGNKEKKEKKEKKSEEVVEVVEESASEDVGITGNMIRFVFGLIRGFGNKEISGRVVANVSLEDEEDFKVVKDKVEELDVDELKVIDDSSVVEMGESEFDIVVDETDSRALNESAESDADYKWGYEVVLKDLKFMAKIDISANESLSIYDENSIKIGRNVLSFKDLVDEGYHVRLVKPNLSMVVAVNVVDVTNDFIEEDLNDVVDLNESVVDVVDLNESVVEDEVDEVVGGNKSVDGEKVKKEKKEKTKKGLTGNVVSLISGFVIADENDSVVVEDVKYENKISVYIERDFSGSGYEIGDVVYLDPTLIIIPISDAEHLDVNRSFVSNIYDDVSSRDGNWSEVIGDSEYVRASFTEELDASKDITVYARVADICSRDLNESIVINGVEIPCEVYEKKKRIDELRRLMG